MTEQMPGELIYTYDRRLAPNVVKHSSGQEA